MTNKYYPVTKEELEQIKRGCFHPDWEICEGCEHESIRGIRCTREVWKLADEVLSRPDPLALLEAWRYRSVFLTKTSYSSLWAAERLVITAIRENPDAVRQQGIKEGWWKE